MSEHRRILADVVSELAAESPECRIVLHGSVQRGDERQDSDLDLIVIQEQGGDRRIDYSRSHRGIRLGLTRYGASWLEESIAAQPHWYWPLSRAQVLRDADGLARRLQSRLRHYFDTHPAVARAWEAHVEHYLRTKSDASLGDTHPTWESFFTYLETEVIPGDASP
jgi:hypothetical protein